MFPFITGLAVSRHHGVSGGSRGSSPGVEMLATVEQMTVRRIITNNVKTRRHLIKWSHLAQGGGLGCIPAHIKPALCDSGSSQNPTSTFIHRATSTRATMVTASTSSKQQRQPVIIISSTGVTSKITKSKIDSSTSTCTPCQLTRILDSFPSKPNSSKLQGKSS
jgi:hypothetical protein